MTTWNDLDHDVLIVGGGFTGASLACALADGSRRILVLEARPGPRANFAGELIHPTGVAVLEALSLRHVLEEAGAVEIDGFAVYRSPLDPPVTLPYAGTPGVVTCGLGIDHDRMVAALRAEAERRPGVEMRYGARVTGLVRERGASRRVCGVRLDGGEELRAHLVLGAEGRHGRLRSELGVPMAARLISYTAALRVPDIDLPLPAGGHILLGAPGPILAYPIGRGEGRACFDLPEAVKPEALPELLRARYLQHVPADLRRSLDRALSSQPVQLVATHGMRAARTVQDGMALVGDAGGCAHPLTAGGMTLCLNDVRLLRESLGSLPLDEALDRFQRERVEMVVSRVALTDALYDIFSGEGQGPQALRDAVFDYWRSPDRQRASMALLAGADTSVAHLAAEYARVVGVAALRSGRLPALVTALQQARKAVDTVRG